MGLKQEIADNGFVWSLKSNPEIHNHIINVPDDSEEWRKQWVLIHEDAPELNRSTPYVRRAQPAHEIPIPVLEPKISFFKKLFLTIGNWFV